MKTILLVLLVLQCSLSLDASVTIRIEASFGAKRKECRGGVGLCSARIARSESAGTKIGSLSLSDDETVLTLVLGRSAFDDCLEQISAGNFIQEEDFELPSELTQALGVFGIVTIRSGHYPALFTEKGIAVTILVSHSPARIE